MAMSDNYALFGALKRISRTTADEICKMPGVALYINLENIRNEDWVRILIKYPNLSDLSPIDKFDGRNWADLICGQPIFLDRCPWQQLRTGEWSYLLGKKKTFLKFLKLEHLSKPYDIYPILETYYSPYTNEPCEGIMTKEEIDPASYMIYRRMDPVNGKLFLDERFAEDYWDFLEELYDLAPEEAFDVHNKEHLPFFVVLKAPDAVFRKFLPSFDLKIRDQGGNSLLLPALLHSLLNENMKRYNFMLDELKVDPDEKNLAGFSCNDLISLVEKNIKKKKGKTNGR